MAVVSSWLELFPSVGKRTQPLSSVIRVRRDRRVSWRKVGMTPGQHVPLMSWAAHLIQWSLQKVATG